MGLNLTVNNIDQTLVQGHASSLVILSNLLCKIETWYQDEDKTSFE